MSAGTYDDFFDKLGLLESGDDYFLVTGDLGLGEDPTGVLGRYQLNEAKLIDVGFVFADGTPGVNDYAGCFTGKHSVSSASVFLELTGAQDTAIREYMGLLWKGLGIDTRFEGQVLDGRLITMSGLLAAAFTAGLPGIKTFLAAGGDVLPLGTPLIQYLDELGDFDNPFKVDHSLDETTAGGSGNDELRGFAGDDSLSGGIGDDTLGGDSGDDTLDGGDGNDRLRGSAGDDELLGGGGNDNLVGNDGIDVLSGDAGADDLHGGDDNDSLSGGGGADKLAGGFGNDMLDGGDGDDQLRGNAGADHIAGGAGADALNGFAGDDSLSGGIGDDTLGGDSGDDTLDGGDGNDRLRGSAGDDELLGGGGNDNLVGNDGIDVLSGDAGADDLHGGDDNDSLSGGGGADKLAGGFGNDRLDGGDGDDQLRGNAGADHIAGGDGDDSLFGGAGADVLRGDAGNDQLDGGDGADYMSGGGGDDTLEGGAGNDALFGEDGNDTLNGGDGIDSMSGGAGNDTYILADRRDIVLEFAGGGNDTARLTAAGQYAFTNVEHVEITSGAAIKLTISSAGVDSLAFDAEDGGTVRYQLSSAPTEKSIEVVFGAGADRFVFDTNGFDPATGNITVGTQNGFFWGFDMQGVEGDDRIDLTSLGIDQVVTGSESSAAEGQFLLAPGARVEAGSLFYENTTSGWFFVDTTTSLFSPLFSGNFVEDNFIV